MLSTAFRSLYWFIACFHVESPSIDEETSSRFGRPLSVSRSFNGCGLSTCKECFMISGTMNSKVVHPERGEDKAISAAFRYQKQRRPVLGNEMAYVEVGQGDPIVLLHGNPTSSYLWRNVLPHVQPLGRCIAPDLIGMGDSDKLPDSDPSSYRFVEHRRYLDALLEELGVRERVTLVVHDWGSGLGFDWANRHREAVRGIAYMGALVQPRGWNDWPEATRSLLKAASSKAWEKMALEGNLWEQALTSGILRTLSEEELAQYRRPFAHPGEDRRPTLAWAQENPLDGDPADVTEIENSYSEWLAQSSVPKLVV